jgi:hypothetical protein
VQQQCDHKTPLSKTENMALMLHTLPNRTLQHFTQLTLQTDGSGTLPPSATLALEPPASSVSCVDEIVLLRRT